MLKRERATVAQRMVKMLELPSDVVLNLPKTTLIGGVQVFVENHAGLLSYGPGEIRIRTVQGEIVITGTGLQIGSILPRELVVDGRISHVELRR